MFNSNLFTLNNVCLNKQAFLRKICLLVVSKEVTTILYLTAEKSTCLCSLIVKVCKRFKNYNYCSAFSCYLWADIYIDTNMQLKKKFLTNCKVKSGMF